MAIYAISDLHLSLAVNKPMDVFGDSWENYMDKIYENWNKTITDTDTVLLPGDFSWATYLEQALPDFRFLNQLPGNKILSKGNHDYYWTTASKLDKFLDKHKLNTIRFLHNNSFIFTSIKIWQILKLYSPNFLTLYL